MPFRTGRQFPIGNGSSLVFLGLQPDNLELDGPGYRAHFIAHIVCDEMFPELVNGVSVSQMAAKAWVMTNHAKAVRGLVGSVDSPIVMPTNSIDWTRVLFWKRVDGELREPEKYVHSISEVLKQVWDLVRFAEFGGADENKVLEFAAERSDKRCPFRPHFLAMAEAAYGKVTSDALDLENYEAGHIVPWILNLCLVRGSWDELSYIGLMPGETILDHLARGTNLSSSECERGLRFLLDNGYLAKGNNVSRYLLREKFVLKCWHTAIGV